MSVQIEVLREATDEAVEAFGRLLPQLSSSATAMDHGDLAEVLACSANTVLLARSGPTIVGTLTLVTFPLPTGLRARIEDVVVDEQARGQGVGAALTHAALARAQKDGAKTVDLTSRPSRTAANRLYQSLGFERRDSQTYRYRLDPQQQRPSGA